ncbi:MAG: DUF2141 domain-containing protein [Vulcanimicrobiota bacterium]
MTEMTRRSLTALALALLLTALCGEYACARESTITVNVKGLKNSSGTVKLALFVSRDGFPFDSSMAVRTLAVPIQNGTAQAVITGVPFGAYAICLFHDEDNTGKLQRNMFGKPREGVGVSNNPPMKNRAPRYEEAQFNVDSVNMTMEITVVYF